MGHNKHRNIPGSTENTCRSKNADRRLKHGFKCTVTFSKIFLSFGSLSPEQPCLRSGDNCLSVLTGTITVCSSNETSCISGMKQNFFIKTY